MDLTKTYPRSPKETLAGLVHIPRMIDKARACSQDSLGQYIFPCPLDKMVLEFLNIEVEEFLEQASSEIRMRLWLLGRCSGKSSEQKQSLNQRILNKKPDRKSYHDLKFSIKTGILTLIFLVKNLAKFLIDLVSLNFI